jgi:hypothetical protein
MNYNMTIKFLLIFFCITVCGFAQNNDEKYLLALAEQKLKLENYDDALEDFLQLHSIDSKSESYNYNLGVCYLNTNVNKAKAVPYFEIACRMENHNPNADFLLGRAYQYANRFDDARAQFEKFLARGKGNPDNLMFVNQEIQHCINAKELIKFPIDIVFQNLGKNINSEFSDYYPFVTENEAFMLYNSNRPLKKNVPIMDNGHYLTTIQVSKVVNGQYMESEPLGKPVNDGNSGEEVIGMNADGSIVLINKPNLKGQSKLYQSNIQKNGEFSKLIELPAAINGSGDVIAACTNNDGNIIYFASNRKGGFGGIDIYVCNKLPNGNWSEAKNLGKEINTALNEDFPNLSPDGKILYFSSKGHSSMGGYDIFKVAINEQLNTYGNPKNMGYPLNTSYDDLNFRISKSGRYGYVSSLRGGGQGDFDIYRVSFNDVEVDYTVLIGQLAAADTLQKVDYSGTFISVNDNITNEIVGNYLPNPATGRFIIILPPGKYGMQVESPGFKDYKKPIEVFDKVSYQSEVSLNIDLKK